MKKKETNKVRHEWINDKSNRYPYLKKLLPRFMPRPDRIMENKENHNHNGSGNGFLLGVIVGVLLTLLFTTKRGRTILKDVMEKGVQKFADLETLMKETEEEMEDEFEDEDGNDYIPEEPERIASPKVTSVQSEPTPQPVEKKPVEKKPVETPKPIEKPVQEEKSAKEEPKFLDQEMQETVAEETPVAKAKEEKTTRVKRLFRGLRKKS